MILHCTTINCPSTISYCNNNVVIKIIMITCYKWLTVYLKRELSLACTTTWWTVQAVFCLCKDEDKEAVKWRILLTFLQIVNGPSLWPPVLDFEDPDKVSQEEFTLSIHTRKLKCWLLLICLPFLKKFFLMYNPRNSRRHPSFFFWVG